MKLTRKERHAALRRDSSVMLAEIHEHQQAFELLFGGFVRNGFGTCHTNFGALLVRTSNLLMELRQELDR